MSVQTLTLLHSKRPKLYRVLAVLSAIGLQERSDQGLHCSIFHQYHLDVLWHCKTTVFIFRIVIIIRHPNSLDFYGICEMCLFQNCAL